MPRAPRVPLVAALLVVGASLGFEPRPAEAARRRPSHEPAGHQTFASPQSNPIAVSADGAFVFVANTTSHSVDVIDTGAAAVTGTVEVGIDPVGLALKPDGSELWVANHVSDSVSVVDVDPASASYLRVVETIQDLDASGVTGFDEPVGIAFASDAKAYVALSSTDRVAIVDAVEYVVSGHLPVTAQDPRALAVANGRLYVAAFESGNTSELSACVFDDGTEQCSFDANDLNEFVTNPNVPGATKNIVLDPDVPDRDLFVFDTATDTPVKTPVTGVGTLLYGLVVDASDRVFVSQTDARNAVNGVVGPAAFRTDPNGDGDVNLADLDNRLFSNQIAIVDCGGGGATCSVGTPVELDGGSPDPATALATPYGISLSGDGSLLVGTAAGTSRVFSMSASGSLLHRLDLDDPGDPDDDGQQIPRGIAFHSSGATGTAYVLNTLENTVSVVSVGVGGALGLGPRIPVGSDPTPEAVRRGRIAFNDAFASTSGSFSCASCHPDGHTDQLLWRIGGECFLGGCVAFEDEPRSTMPVRGLRDTLPLHWDGSLGDPFGGPNGASGNGGSPPGSNCSLGVGGDPQPCFRQLVDASLSGVMCRQIDAADPLGNPPPDGHFRECPDGPSGLPGRLDAAARDAMASFLESVSYPPARERATDDTVSATALAGFEDFFMDQTGGGNPDTCADSNAGCHELPLGTGTNAELLQAFDVPTLRGLNDRFLQFSLGTASVEEVQTAIQGSSAWKAQGLDEFTVLSGAFSAVFTPVYGADVDNVFQMVQEMSTGHSGALGRQVTLNTRTTAGCPACDLEALLADLEAADAREVVNLRGAGLRGGPVELSYLAPPIDRYQVGSARLPRSQLISEAQGGLLLATLTAQLPAGVSEETPQPLIAPLGAQCGTGTGPSGDPALPTNSSFDFEGAHVASGDAIFLNGQDTGLTVTVVGTASSCPTTAGPITTQRLSVSGLSRGPGTDLLQVRGANGLLSNEMPLP